MKISLNWLRDYVALPSELSPAEVAHRLTVTTVEVEAVSQHASGNDVVFTIDNKSLTNRPDLWGHYGIARELAAMDRLPLPPVPGAEVSGVTDHPELVEVADPVCDRLLCLKMAADASAVSPEGICRRLQAVQCSPSGRLVTDLAGYMLHAVGQPLHVLDADAVVGRLRTLRCEQAASVVLSDGHRAEVAAGDLLLSDDRGAVALLGIDTALRVTPAASTTRYLILAPTVLPRQVRRTATRMGLRTPASIRMEKGLATPLVGEAIRLCRHLLAAHAPNAEVLRWCDHHPRPTPQPQITITREWLVRRLGVELSLTEITELLTRLGFSCQVEGTRLTCGVPWWRATGDVSGPHDLVEEVARLYGYDALPRPTLRVNLTPPSQPSRSLARAVSEHLSSGAGLHEVVTYPWLSAAECRAWGWAADGLLHLEPEAAGERHVLRPSLLPGLVNALVSNHDHGQLGCLYEVGTVFGVAGNAPIEGLRLAIALPGTDGRELFLRAKSLVESLACPGLLADLSCGPRPETEGDPASPWLDRQARLAVNTPAGPIGALGLLTPVLRTRLGVTIPQVAVVEIALDTHELSPRSSRRYQPISDLPTAQLDLSLVLADQVSWRQLDAEVRRASPLVAEVAYLGEYRGDWVPGGHRSLSLRLTLHGPGATLTAADIGAARQVVLEATRHAFNAHPREG